MTKAPTPAEMSKGQGDDTNNATKKFDYTAVADRLRTVSWSNYGHPTGKTSPNALCFFKLFKAIRRQVKISVRCPKVPDPALRMSPYGRKLSSIIAPPPPFKNRMNMEPHLSPTAMLSINYIFLEYQGVTLKRKAKCTIQKAYQRLSVL